MDEKPRPPSVRERVEIIADLMASGRFQPRMTCRSLAIKWGLSHKTVEGNASEASRSLVISAENRDGMRAMAASTAWSDRKKALEQKRPDFHAAQKSLEQWVRWSGLEVEEDRPAFVQARQPRVIKVVYGDDTPKADDDGSAGRQPPKQDPGGDA